MTSTPTEARLRYGSVCSGIEAATMAWHPLGWSPAFFSEIERFPSAVLAHHYGSNMPGEKPSPNGVPNYGDMTKFQEWPDHAIDLLVGGTPCQSFSVAGLRKGLADPRGNLMLTYLAIARRYQPRWLVWENVPGVLSSAKGRDFATFLRGLEECGYHAAWRVLDAQYIRVDGFGRAVPQRRRRVFVVGYLGDWRRPAAVFLERESLRGDSAPRRQSEQAVAGTIDASAARSRGAGVNPGMISSTGPIAHCLNAGGMGRQDYETETMIAFAQNQRDDLRTMDVAGALAAEPGMKQQTYLATPYTLAIRGRDGQPDLEYRQDGTANAVLTPNGGRAGIGVGAIAFNPKAGGNSTIGKSYLTDGSSYTLDTDCTSVAIAHAIQAGALRENPDSGPDGIGVQADIAYTLEARAEVQAVQEKWAVRRLTPTECERLQAFPDGYTNIPWRGKETAPDGPRYKALGNSMAVNAMRWIGRRIDMVETLSDELDRSAAA